jgi:hypothetical protein
METHINGLTNEIGNLGKSRGDEIVILAARICESGRVCPTDTNFHAGRSNAT